MGHKRLALEAGEDPLRNPIDYILESIQTIYGIHHKNGAIRRVNVNIAATTVENYRRLRDAGIGTYILFQETYHKGNYETLHPTGPKSKYSYHTEAMDRAMEGGIDDVGIGVLFGLNTYRYDFVGLLMHAEHLEAAFGVGPHTISVPRICPADDIETKDFPNAISDEMFCRLVAVIRIAVPYTGMIISTRESEAVRRKVLELGISQISGGSRTSVGGYAVPETKEENSAQFDISDRRTLDEVVNWLLDLGHIPSFCTACYREGRTGDRFMSLVKRGQIANCCPFRRKLYGYHFLLSGYGYRNGSAAGRCGILFRLQLLAGFLHLALHPLRLLHQIVHISRNSSAGKSSSLCHKFIPPLSKYPYGSFLSVLHR